MPIEISSEDVVWIGGDLYCKTPEVLAIALKQCRTIGYEIKDNRVDGFSVQRGEVTPEQMEQNGWSLWYASFDVRRGKCRSCGSYISLVGIMAHGHTCEVCGAVTYRNIIDGSTVRFYFLGEERGFFGPELNMEAKRWDDENGWLYLKYEFHPGGLGVFTGDKAKEYLARHKDKWELVQEDGQTLVKIHYASSLYVQEDDVIGVSQTWGHEQNADIVKVWDCKEYREWDRLPIPESFSIYETWHWAPLEASPTLHKRVLHAVHNTDDKGWHYQDGRPWFSRESFAEMSKFVRHFTTLDADAWDERSQQFRLDGPGGIDDVAKFCHPEAEVEDRPNIGNFLVGLSKFASGQRMTEGEAEAMARAAKEDPLTQDFTKTVVTSERPNK